MSAIDDSSSTFPPGIRPFTAQGGPLTDAYCASVLHSAWAPDLHSVAAETPPQPNELGVALRAVRQALVAAAGEIDTHKSYATVDELMGAMPGSHKQQIQTAMDALNVAAAQLWTTPAAARWWDRAKSFGDRPRYGAVHAAPTSELRAAAESVGESKSDAASSATATGTSSLSAWQSVQAWTWYDVRQWFALLKLLHDRLTAPYDELPDSNPSLFMDITHPVPGLTDASMGHWGAPSQMVGAQCMVDIAAAAAGPHITHTALRHPFTAALFTPTLGMVGPGSLTVTHGDSGKGSPPCCCDFGSPLALAWHAAVHDAAGQSLLLMGVGPGYAYRSGMSRCIAQCCCGKGVVPCCLTLAYACCCCTNANPLRGNTRANVAWWQGAVSAVQKEHAARGSARTGHAK